MPELSCSAMAIVNIMVLIAQILCKVYLCIAAFLLSGNLRQSTLLTGCSLFMLTGVNYGMVILQMKATSE